MDRQSFRNLRPYKYTQGHKVCEKASDKNYTKIGVSKGSVMWRTVNGCSNRTTLSVYMVRFESSKSNCVRYRRVV